MRLLWLAEAKGENVPVYAMPNGRPTLDPNAAVKFKTRGRCEAWIRRELRRGIYEAREHAWPDLG